jgi:hypothetical protein
MSSYLTSLKVCHVGLFVCLELADRHGRRQGAVGRPGHGPGQLWPVEPVSVVGGHWQLGRRGPLPAGEGGLGSLASIPTLGKVPG